MIPTATGRERKSSSKRPVFTEDVYHIAIKQKTVYPKFVPATSVMKRRVAAIVRIWPTNLATGAVTGLKNSQGIGSGLVTATPNGAMDSGLAGQHSVRNRIPNLMTTPTVEARFSVRVLLLIVF